MAYLYKAHINEDKIQTVKEHSKNTADLCRQFAIPVLKDVMYTIGMAHDIGKYQKDFQDRLSGNNIRVEHSSCGALVMKEMYPNAIGLLMEYCIAGHHTGIPDGGHKNDTSDMSTLCGRLKREFHDFNAYKKELIFPEIKADEVITFFIQDCANNQELFVDKFAFLTRYSFSCLVDADSMDTAEFCSGDKIRPLKADFNACLLKINQKLKSFVCTTALQETRALLQRQVFEKVDKEAEIYLMNMPTGSGKTLCSMKFALERVKRTGKKRIIYIIPYNSIIDQTVAVFEDLFGKDAEILRHQSTFSYEKDKDNNYTEDYRKEAKRAAENWNVNSIIVTTAVQFFESVYDNKRGKLRKLHNMADSVLVFDEAHLMPEDYLQPCLRAIAYITRYLKSEAVFLTATMPDFGKLLKRYTFGDSKIENLIEDTSLFSKFQKCSYQYIGQVRKETILEEAMKYPSSLIIVNRKQMARKLFEECGGKKYHLSTYMTAFDRKRVIKDIQLELKKLELEFPNYEEIPEERRIMIISTSLIEAGIDLDIFTVFRELTGLDSILQSGGRCNREGKREKGEVILFEFEGEDKTKQDIRSNLTKGIIAGYEDISCPESIREYYQRLFSIKSEDNQKNTITQNCRDISYIPFNEYAREFEIIDTSTVSLIVPEDDVSREIVNNLKYTGGGIGIGRQLQKYACSLYLKELEDLISQHAVDDYDTGIWCLTNLDYYSRETGVLFDAKDYFL